MRTWNHRPSTEACGSLALLIGLVGPSGGGKTKSALRLAAGIQKIRGGKVVALDTETKRVLHYRKEFTFEHIDFKPPFSSLDYCEALDYAAKVAEGGVVIVDSMSHEHEGPGGYLDYHAKEVKRLMAEGGFKNEYTAGMPAWNKPSGDRRKLINAVLQADCAFIFCFRAKEKIKLITGKQPINLGWQHIAGDEFAFEMTAKCLLPPGAEGVPDWSLEAFKYQCAKWSDSLKPIFPVGKQLDESIGESLALWAKGDSVGQPVANEQPATKPEKPADLTTDYKAFGTKFSEQLLKCTSIEELEKLKSENTDKLLGMAEEWKVGFAKIEGNIEKAAKNLSPVEEQ